MLPIILRKCDMTQSHLSSLNPITTDVLSLLYFLPISLFKSAYELYRVFKISHTPITVPNAFLKWIVWSLTEDWYEACWQAWRVRGFGEQEGVQISWQCEREVETDSNKEWMRKENADKM